jgi:hypothetical protein
VAPLPSRRSWPTCPPRYWPALSPTYDQHSTLRLRPDRALSLSAFSSARKNHPDVTGLFRTATADSYCHATAARVLLAK